MKTSHIKFALIIPALVFAASSPFAWSADKPGIVASGSTAKPAPQVSSSTAALVTFGSDSVTAGKGKPSGPNAATVSFVENKDGIRVDTPNFWSCLLQFEKIEADFSATSPKDFLTIQIKGTPRGDNPTLKVLFFTPDWKQKSTWVFDLKNIDPNEYTTVKATTPLNKPQEAPEGNTIEFNGVFGVLQMATRTDNSNEPWTLEIKSIGFAH